MVRRLSALLVALAVALMFTSASVVAAQPSTGFATYKITVNTPMGGHSLLVNETVKGSDKPGFSDVILQLTGTTQNLTYSRLVNSSMAFLPYLPTIPSQSFDYSNKTFRVHVNFTEEGTEPVSFQGSNYTLTVYGISLLGTYGNRTFSAAGSIDAFPSSLVYSVSLTSGILFQGSAVLQRTNLQLNQASTSMSAVAYVGVGLGAVGVAAAALMVRRRDRRAKVQEQKPLHWVD